MFGGFKKSRTFATAIERESDKKLNGALVQLVRIHACHAWGHGFESRTHRRSLQIILICRLFLCYKL